MVLITCSWHKYVTSAMNSSPTLGTRVSRMVLGHSLSLFILENRQGQTTFEILPWKVQGRVQGIARSRNWLKASPPPSNQDKSKRQGKGREALYTLMSDSKFTSFYIVSECKQASGQTKNLRPPSPLSLIIFPPKVTTLHKISRTDLYSTYNHSTSLHWNSFAKWKRYSSIYDIFSQ